MLELARAGAERGWKERVLSPFAASEGGELEELCPAGTYAAHRGSGWRDVLKARSWLERQLSSFQPQIVHAHLFHALVLIASLRHPPARQLVATHHHGSRYVSEKQRLHEWADRFCGRRYDAVVAVSRATRQFLIEHYGYQPAKLWTIPNGWSGVPQPRNGAAGRRIICVANFRPQKGHDVLLSAFVRVRRSLPDASLVLVGDGELRETLTGQTVKLGVDDVVRFEGSVPDVWPLLAGADLFAIASRYEPLGLAVLEAMAAGLPVVATDVGGLRELVRPGITGELVPPDDPEALAEHLLGLLQEPARLAQMGAAGREQASDYRVERMLDKYSELYRHLCDEP
jgi:glycosyltransferase involved in cell wall biosynthesis